MRYNYEVIADKIGNKGGEGIMQPHAVTIHHSAVQSDTNYDVVSRAASYAAYHGGSMPYHFLIPFNDDNKIYCTQYITNYTWHNSNYIANKDTIAICLDGNFEIDKPRTKQLEKLKQILDDLSANYFSANGWTKFDTGIEPKDNKLLKEYSDGVKVKTLHWHNEVAQPGYPTACCGINLKPYIEEYRSKQGNVSWGAVKPTPTPVPMVNNGIYIVRSGGWRSNVVQEIINAGIWSGSWQANLDKFNALNPATPQGGWSAGDIVTVGMEIKVVPKPVVKKVLVVDNKEINKLKAEKEALIKENDKKIAEITTKLESENLELLDSKVKKIDELEIELEKYKKEYVAIKFQNEERANITADIITKGLSEEIESRGIFTKYSNFIDGLFQSNVMKSFFKYDVFVLIGWCISTISLIALFPQLPEGLSFYLSTVLGLLFKILLTRYDSNKDGRLDSSDFISLNS